MNLKPIMRLLCHQREDRSYKVCNSYLLVCARCLGIYTGFLFSFLLLLIIYGFFTRTISVLYAFALIVPMATDGFSQAFRLRESKNWLRFITGYLTGMSAAYIFYALLTILLFQPLGRLPANEFILGSVFMFAFIFLLEKSSNFKNIFLKKFFNFIAVFSAAFLILGVIAVYFLIIINILFS